MERDAVAQMTNVIGPGPVSPSLRNYTLSSGNLALFSEPCWIGTVAVKPRRSTLRPFVVSVFKRHGGFHAFDPTSFAALYLTTHTNNMPCFAVPQVPM